MSKHIIVVIALAIILLGIFLPSWYIGLPGLLLLAVLMPLWGVGAGFAYDVYFGASPFLPQIINYPFMLLAFAISLLSLFLRDYIR